MKKAEVYYFGSYSTSISKFKRRCTLSAMIKIDYIISALNQAGYNIELISASYITENKWCFDKGGIQYLNDKSVLNLSPSFGFKTIIGKYLNILFTTFCFFIKLLKLKKNDTLIVYHGNWYSLPITIAKRIRGFKLIVEVEEIYTYAFNRNIKGLKKELKFIKSANALILVNDLLADYLKYPKDKTIISYGPYNISDVSSLKFNDNKIHLVYAGSFSKRKSGAQSSIAAAEFLPDNYVMHILGYGDEETTKEIKQQIEDVNKKTKCKVIFEGEKRGVDYESFMKSCHIGLCTQKLECDYTLYAFPSKILAYLGFGLNVVATPLAALPSSAINKYITYCNEDSASALANAIKNINMYDKKILISVITKLNDSFIKDIKNIIQQK